MSNRLKYFVLGGILAASIGCNDIDQNEIEAIMKDHAERNLVHQVMIERRKECLEQGKDTCEELSPEEIKERIEKIMEKK